MGSRRAGGVGGAARAGGARRRLRAGTARVTGRADAGAAVRIGRPSQRIDRKAPAFAHTRYVSEGRALACFAVILSSAALSGIVVTVTESDRIIEQVDRAADEIVQYTADLVRIPTVNPPGDEYAACARFIGEGLARRGFAVEYIAAEGRPEHTAR